jgi:hypothetical protein
MCGYSLKTDLWKFVKSLWEHYMSKNIYNKFLYFQSYKYKIFVKIHHVSRVLLYV